MAIAEKKETFLKLAFGNLKKAYWFLFMHNISFSICVHSHFFNITSKRTQYIGFTVCELSYLERPSRHLMNEAALVVMCVIQKPFEDLIIHVLTGRQESHHMSQNTHKETPSRYHSSLSLPHIFWCVCTHTCRCSLSLKLIYTHSLTHTHT